MAQPDTSDYKIGVSSGSMIALGSLSTAVTDPKSTYSPYSREQKLVSGLVRGIGFPIATWQWGIITRAERDALRAYCPGKSAAVYIRTKTMDSSDSYHTYSATMVWPTQEEERDTQRRIGLKITFQALVLIS